MSSASRVTYVRSGGTAAAASSSRGGASASPTGSGPTLTSRVPAACAAAAPSGELAGVGDQHVGAAVAQHVRHLVRR